MLLPNLSKAFTKVFDFLMRKGYNSNDILKHMDEFLAIINQ
jgi:SOS response regulatory protein OraA/RecX